MGILEGNSMRRRYVAVAFLVSGLWAAPAVLADEDEDADGQNGKSFKARLSGYSEVPAISTTGQGRLRLTLDEAGTSLAFELEYSELKGATVSAAHIHLGAPRTNGGPVAFLCGGGGKPACPASGPVAGSIIAGDIVANAAQGVDAGDFAAFSEALRAGVTYANVHTDRFPNGEIRGNIGWPPGKSFGAREGQGQRPRQRQRQGRGQRRPIAPLSPTSEGGEAA
jgi:hypothetical protein